MKDVVSAQKYDATSDVISSYSENKRRYQPNKEPKKHAFYKIFVGKFPCVFHGALKGLSI